MPRIQRTPKTFEPEAAICIHAFRPGVVASMIERGDQLPLDHHAVMQYPDYFRGVVPLTREEVKHDAS